MTILFFDFGSGEIFLIVLAIFLVFGPGKIPELARGLGKFINEIKRASEDVKQEINREADRLEREKKLEKYQSEMAQKETVTNEKETAEDSASEETGSSQKATSVANEDVKPTSEEAEESETIRIKPAENTVSTKR